MSEPRMPEHHATESLERARGAVLAAARPLPETEDTIIDDLTEDEDRLFLAAIAEA